MFQAISTFLFYLKRIVYKFIAVTPLILLYGNTTVLTFSFSFDFYNVYNMSNGEICLYLTYSVKSYHSMLSCNKNENVLLNNYSFLNER